MTKVIADSAMSLDGFVTESGAMIMGRRLFDVVNHPDGWSENMGYGADQTGTPLFKPGTRQMYRQRDVRTSWNAVHLTYERVGRDEG